MKKILLLLVCIGLMSFVIACGSKSSENDSNKSNTNTEAAKTVVPTKTAEASTPATVTPAPATKAPATVTPATQAPATAAPAAATKKPVVKPANIKLGSTWKEIHKFDYKNPFFGAGFNSVKNGVTVGLSGEIHNTDNGGKEWPRSENKSACRFGVEYATDKVIYTSGNAGDVTKSTDGGKTFTKKTKFGSSAPDQCQCLSFCEENTGIIASHNKMAITTDGADTWTELTISSEVLSIYMTSPDVFYYIDTDLNLNKTVDGGKTWESTPMNIPEADDCFMNIGNFGLYVDADNAYTVFFVQKSTRLVKSYSTIDNWGKIKENKLPKVSGIGTFYINREGKFVTYSNTGEKTITVLERK